MDTFMDKLAQRLNAQEMIKANTSAEVAETTRLKEQNAMYEALLQKVQESCAQSEAGVAKLEQGVVSIAESTEKVEQGAVKVSESAERVEQGALKVAESAEKTEQGALKVAESAEKVEQNSARVEELISAALAKIAEIQQGEQNTEELNALLEDLKRVQEDKFENLTDHVHKENVKVYRNVQAVVVEELAKSNDLSAKKLASTSRKVTFVLVLSLLTMLVSAAGLAFQILVYLNII